jgi:hypothetical protein
MKKLSWRLWLVLALVCLASLTQILPALGADDAQPNPSERLDRLERRLNEMAQRQEQLLRRLGTPAELSTPMAQPGPEGIQRPTAPEGQPMPPGPRALREGPLPADTLAPVVANAIHKLGGLVKLCILVGIIFNILLAMWIFSDIRRRGEGSGLFVVLALFAGVPAALIYSLVRLGDRKA